MDVSQALSVRPGTTAIIGSGGKTTLLRTLAAELSRTARVIVCTTTHIFPEQTMPCLVSPTAQALAAALDAAPCVCVGSLSEHGKFGPPELPFSTLMRLADYVLTEADGAKRLPLKAHAPHEPVIPPEANQTILVVGASGFGKSAAQSVHRAQLFAEKFGVSPDVSVTPALLAQLLRQEGLCTRVLINQVESEQDIQNAKALAALLPYPVAMAALQRRWLECLS